MPKKLKLVYTAPEAALRAYGESVNKMVPAYVAVGAFARAVVPTTKGKWDERKALVVASFDKALHGLDNAIDTLRVYLSDAIMVALVPDVTVMIKAEGAKIGEKATQKLDLASVTQYRDIKKLAGAARVRLNIVKVKGSGAVAAAPDAPTVETIKTHVVRMMGQAAGQALLQQWAGEIGIWLDFKVNTVAESAPVVVTTKTRKNKKVVDATIAA